MWVVTWKWIVVWETRQTWHYTPRSRGKNNLGTNRRSGIRMKRTPVYKQYSCQKWMPVYEEVTQLPAGVH